MTLDRILERKRRGIAVISKENVGKRVADDPWSYREAKAKGNRGDLSWKTLVDIWLMLPVVICLSQSGGPVLCDVASRSDIYSAGTLTAVLLSELGVVAFSMAVVIRLITPRVICLSLQTTEPYSSAFEVITIFSLLWPQNSVCWLVDASLLA